MAAYTINSDLELVGGSTIKGLPTPTDLGDAASKEYVDAHSGGGTFVQSRYRFSDFEVVATPSDPFLGAAIATGTTSSTLTSAAADVLHPGLAWLRSSGTLNSGYRWFTGGLLTSAAGLFCRTIMSLRGTSILTNKMARIGFHNATSVTVPTDGAYFEINGGVATARTTNNASTSTSAGSLTMTRNTFYTLDIEYLTASSVRFTIRDDAGDLLFDETLITNVPASTTRFFAVSTIITNGNSTADELMLLDYMGFGPEKPSWA